MHTIEIDDEVMDALKRKAEPFIDTPNTVLRRLLGIDGATAQRAKHAAPAGRLRPAGRRRTPKSAGKNARSVRVPAGSILPEEEYVRPLLEVLVEKGGRAAAREVIDEVGQRLRDRLTPLDREPLESGGLRWQNRIQFARLRLIDRGLVKKHSPRGLWEITEKGSDFARSQQEAEVRE